MNKNAILMTAMLALSALVFVPSVDAHTCTSTGTSPSSDCDPGYCGGWENHSHSWYLPGGVLVESCYARNVQAVAAAAALTPQAGAEILA